MIGSLHTEERKEKVEMTNQKEILSLVEDTVDRNNSKKIRKIRQRVSRSEDLPLDGHGASSHFDA